MLGIVKANFDTFLWKKEKNWKTIAQEKKDREAAREATESLHRQGRPNTPEAPQAQGGPEADQIDYLRKPSTDCNSSRARCGQVSH